MFPINRQGRSSILAGTIALVVAVSLPALSFWQEYRSLEAGLQGSNRVRAAAVTRVINQYPDTWRFRRDLLAELLAFTDIEERREGVASVLIVDLEGRIVVESGEEPRGPPIVRRAEIYDFGTRVGYVESRYSLRSMIWRTVWAGVVGLILGAFVYAVLRRLQRRVVQRTTELELTLSHLRRQSRIRAVLSGINSAIVRIRDRQQLFTEACRIAVEHGNFGLAWVGLFDPATLDVTPVAWTGLGWEEFNRTKSSARADVPLGQGAVGRAIRERKPVFDNDISASPGVAGKRRQEALQLGYRSLIALPLFAEDAVAGILALFVKEPNFFDAEEVKLLTELAGDISFALQSISRQEKLEFLSYYDALTGLPNRQLFVDRISQQMRARSGEQRMVALILLDLDRFRNINETLGRHGGDELLKLAAHRLEHAFHGRDYLAHIGADNFGVVIRGVQDAAEIAHVVESQVLACFKEPFVVNDRELRVVARTGIALFPSDGGDADILFKNAEAALRNAKASGERYLFYAPAMNARVAEQLKVENQLRVAVLEEQFVLHYQPRVELRTGRICGLEALIRWMHPQRGLVPPGEFIPILEDTGLILEAGRWALKRAARDNATWRAAGLKPPRIAVNVSAVQLRRKEFVENVRTAVSEAGDSREHIDVEITESMLMEDIEGSIDKLKAVQAMGMQVALDDFGTGYSSLSYLVRLPINSLKIDRSFVSQMSKGPEQMAIVSTVISLAQALNLKVVAEGVETEEQANLLRLLRCDEAQGYLFGRPVPPEELEGRLRQA